MFNLIIINTQGAQKFYGQKLATLLSYFPCIFPPNIPKNQLKLRIHSSFKEQSIINGGGYVQNLCS